MFCKNCGAKIKDGAQFCPECGTKVIQTELSRSTPKQENNSIEQLLKKRGIDQIWKNITKRQLIDMGVVTLAVVLAFVLISGIKKGEDKETASLEQETVQQEDIKQEILKQDNVEQQSAEKDIHELTLDEQLSLMKEYMDTLNIDGAKGLLTVMVEQHVYEPDLYLELADIMLARGKSDSAIEMLVIGYQNTNDEQIKSKLLDLQTRAEVGDENAKIINDALGIAEDIADDLGYGETVEKGKNLFDTLYGVYLENK